VDSSGIDTPTAPPVNKITIKLLASMCFFLLLGTWLSVPYGAGPDMDYHMASIWCAWGEKPDICENAEFTEQDPTAQFRNNASAEVPFMFQLCDSRNIDFWPYCEVETERPETQRLRMAPPEHMSLYYKVAHTFVGDGISQSVLRIRLMNNLIASAVLFLLLTITTKRIAFASLVGFTFTLIPNGVQILSGVTTRAWAVLGVMSSWAFFASYLSTDRSNRSLRTSQLIATMFTFLLALSARLDAAAMVAITLIVVYAAHLLRNRVLTTRQIAISLLGASGLWLVLRQIPMLYEFVSVYVPSNYSARQYLLFQIVHLPEFVADWWGYRIGQQGNGPGIVGLIGVVLFFVNLAFALVKSSKQQRFITTGFAVIICALLFKSTAWTGSIVPLTGIYTLGMALPWLGLTVQHSSQSIQFMSSPGHRKISIFFLSFAHMVTFYSLIEFYTMQGKNVGYFESLTLNGTWWWNMPIGPNFVFLAGAILFPAFLTLAWKSIDLQLPE
jgi:hypothetical protein